MTRQREEETKWEMMVLDIAAGSPLYYSVKLFVLLLLSIILRSVCAVPNMQVKCENKDDMCKYSFGLYNFAQS